MSYMGYAGGFQEILDYIGDAISVGAGEADTLDETDVEEWMRRIDDTIDATLNQIYYVPLIKITRPDRDGGSITKYPDPISRMSIIFTAVAMLRQKYKDISPNAMPASIEKDEEEMKMLLMSIVNNIGVGSIRLEGQRFKGRNRFVSPSIIPSTPTTPTTGPGGTIGGL